MKILSSMHNGTVTRDRAVRAILLALIAFLPAALHAQGNAKPLFTRLDSAITGINFANIVVEDEIFNINNFIYAYNGGGVAVGDVNNDGLLDLYFSGTQPQTPNRLYLNRGNLRFEDVSVKAGVNDNGSVRYGVVMVDINADGWLDIYVNKQHHANTLYINNKNGTFTERAKEFGLDYCCSSTQSSFFDYDRDGDLDVYIGVNGDATGDDYTRKGKVDKLFRNNGDNTFTDVTEQAGLSDKGYALSVSVGDVNNDGWPDVYITNDFEWHDILYINNGDGTFKETTKKAMKHTTEFGMGSDIADFNDDGLLDIIAVDMLPEDHWRKMSHMGSQNSFSPLFDSGQAMRNTLQLNRGNGMFSDVGQLAGIAETDWSWSSLFADFDHDGLTDLFISNGYKRDVANLDVIRDFTRHSPLEIIAKVPSIKLKNYGFKNTGDLTFKKVSDEWGLGDYVNSNGTMYADLDNDGDEDLIINNIDTLSTIYRNNAVEFGMGNWLKVKLEGTGKNLNGIGARVQIRAGGRTQIREYSATRGYLSSRQDALHFGLGDAEKVDRLLITWPDGSAQVLENVTANDVIVLKQSDASGAEDIEELRTPTAVAQAFVELDDSGLDFRHVENPYDDFNRERLLPHRLSRNGPGMAVGDVDGNGLDDVFIGSAKFGSRGLFLQKAPGKFVASADTAAFARDYHCEDLGSLFFDADSDGDLDLYIVSGGNEFNVGDSALQDRIYLNDGKGVFAYAPDALPDMRTSKGNVSAADYDQDGDLDLFVGGRAVPGLYPDIPRSYILENRKGKFADVTEAIAPELPLAGMVCAAIWSDFNGDNRPDLVLTGEWMGIHFYKNDGGKKFVEVTKTTGLDSINGWWHSLSSGDFDNDGDVDYIAGNMGLNTRSTVTPTPGGPISLYANDFDGNTSRDLIMSYYYAGSEFPARSRDDAKSQMGTYINRKFPTYTRYAMSRIDQIYAKEKLDAATKLTATTFTNSYVENLGNGKFRLHRLPTLAQAAPIYGTVVADFNGDGNLDVLAMENFYAPDREIVRYDAGFGLYLRGNGRGGFEVTPILESGFVVPYDGRSLSMVDIDSDTSVYVVATNNNGKAQVFRRNLPANARIVKADPSKGYTHAVVELADGRERRQEFLMGSGYLSQSSCVMVITPDVKQITFYKGTKKGETIEPDDDELFGAAR